MPKVWNIGNTTVRNPRRIENALKVYLEEGFSGNAKGSDTEARLHLKLKENDILDFDGNPSDFNGRKWRAAFYQLGFISYDKYKINSKQYSSEELFHKLSLKKIKHNYQVTPVGHKLIEAKSIPEIEEIYLRQFMCYEIPNALESGFPEGKMKPFVLFLQVLKIIQEQFYEGLTKFETGLFLQQFYNHRNELAEEIVDNILEYRKKLSDCSTVKEIKKLNNKYSSDLETKIGIQSKTVTHDYADTTFRYFSLSGLFTRIGQTIVIRTNKIKLVEALLNPEPTFLYSNDGFDYFTKYYSNSYELPTDSKAFALHDIDTLKNSIRDKKNPLLQQANKLTIESSYSEIKKIRFDLIIYNNWEREEDYANEQQNEENIKDIIGYLKVLNGEKIDNAPDIDDRPAYLEWAVWRSFLAINNIISPVHKTRRFPVDEDFRPRNTAPGGGSDLLIEFESFVLVVEVTLTNSHRQMAVESEPVRRHTVQYKEEFPNKDVYCLFIAPSVDNNVAETFRIGVWYKGDIEEFVNIVPMNLTDFILTIELLTIKKYSNLQFKNLIERCLVFRNVRAPHWLKTITSEVDIWKNRIIENT